MDIAKLFSGLRLNCIRNVIIYASFILLVISLLFPLQNIDNNFVQKASLSFFIYGLALWLLEHVAIGLGETEPDDTQMVIIVAWVILALIGFCITFKIAFGISFIGVFKGGINLNLKNSSTFT